MPRPRWEVALALLAWTRDGVRPSPTLTAGKHGYRSPYRGLSGLDGGSGNISLELAAAHLAAGVPEALEYLEDRCEDELSHGLGGGEQLSPAYEHLSFWALTWWTAWKLGHEYLRRLSGAWIERHLLVSCLLGRLEHGVLAVYAPGMRADHGADRSVEEAIVAHLLGIGHPLSTNLDLPERKWWWGGILLEAVRQAEEIERVADGVQRSCLELLGNKLEAAMPPMPHWWQEIAYHVPVHVEIYGPQEWLAWMEAGGEHWTGHGQDPAMAWGGVIGGKPTVGLPYEPGEGPPEEGWGAHANRFPGGLMVDWTRHGKTYANRSLGLPTPLHTLTFHRPTADPLGDLPPLPPPPGDEPRKPGPKPELPDEKPKEEEPMPEEPRERVPAPKVAKDPDLAWVQTMLESIRGNEIEPKVRRRRAHRSLVKLNLTGAWDWEER